MQDQGKDCTHKLSSVTNKLLWWSHSSRNEFHIFQQSACRKSGQKKLWCHKFHAYVIIMLEYIKYFAVTII